MPVATRQPPNHYFLRENDLKHLPPYFQETPEHPVESQCPTTGEWPTWLKGSYMRVGGGRMKVPTSEDDSTPPALIQHFFDGLNTLTKFRIADGKVYYMSRYTAEGAVRRAKKEGLLKAPMFGLNANTPVFEAIDPCSELLGQKQCLWAVGEDMGPDEGNINVVPRRGYHLPKDTNPKSMAEKVASPETQEIIIHTDFNALQVLDAKTLQPKRLLTYAKIDNELDGFGICAHPPKDRKRGQAYNYVVSRQGELFVFGLDMRSDPTKLLWKTKLPCPPCYIHSLAMTDKYVVFVRNPLHMDFADPEQPLMNCIKWEEGESTQCYVIDRADGKLVSIFEHKRAFMFFHCVNAFDVKNANGKTDVFVDVCSYEAGQTPFREYVFSNILDPADQMVDGTLVRYKLGDIEDNADLNQRGRVTVDRAIPGVAAELPRISKDASMKPDYRYVYFTAGNGGPSPGTQVPIGKYSNGLKAVHSAFLGALAKSDWKDGSFKMWQPENGDSCPCEPVFIGRPGATEEDDGIVVTIVINREGTHSDLVALDGKTFKEVARAEMPQVYGMGPHGSFVEGDFGV